MESCLYEGVVHHERLWPVKHRFDRRLFMAYLDLEEVPGLVRAGVLSSRRLGLASFRRADHFGAAATPLACEVRERVSAETDLHLDGPIRVLTHLRQLGHYFSPLNLFYCFDGAGRSVRAVVAEVQNIPWRERHCYVLWDGNRDHSTSEASHRHDKTFHVSPFMSMDMEYRWVLSEPGQELRATIDAASTIDVPGSEPFFRAALRLTRRPLSRRGLLALVCRYPLMTAQVTAGIYLEAFHLWRKKCPFYPHPKHLACKENRAHDSDRSRAYAARE